MRIRVLQHVPHEGPAAIAEWAKSRGHEVVTTRVDLEGAPSLDEACEILVILGGPMGVLDDERYPWLTAEKHLIARALDRAHMGLSAVVGVCLGAQLIAHVLGASVARNPELEIGWYPVRLTHESAKAVALAGFPEDLSVLHWHGDTFATPADAIHVLSSDACANQAFEAADGRIVGLQFHLEQTSDSLPVMIAGNADELGESGAYIQSGTQIMQGLAAEDRCRAALYSILDGVEKLVR